ILQPDACKLAKPTMQGYYFPCSKLQTAHTSPFSAKHQAPPKHMAARGPSLRQAPPSEIWWPHLPGRVANRDLCGCTLNRFGVFPPKYTKCERCFVDRRSGMSNESPSVRDEQEARVRSIQW